MMFDIHFTLRDTITQREVFWKEECCKLLTEILTIATEYGQKP